MNLWTLMLSLLTLGSCHSNDTPSVSFLPSDAKEPVFDLSQFQKKEMKEIQDDSLPSGSEVLPVFESHPYAVVMKPIVKSRKSVQEVDKLDSNEESRKDSISSRNHHSSPEYENYFLKSKPRKTSGVSIERKPNNSPIPFSIKKAPLKSKTIYFRTDNGTREFILSHEENPSTTFKVRTSRTSNISTDLQEQILKVEDKQRSPYPLPYRKEEGPIDPLRISDGPKEDRNSHGKSLRTHNRVRGLETRDIVNFGTDNGGPFAEPIPNSEENTDLLFHPQGLRKSNFQEQVKKNRVEDDSPRNGTIFTIDFNQTASNRVARGDFGDTGKKNDTLQIGFIPGNPIPFLPSDSRSENHDSHTSAQDVAEIPSSITNVEITLSNDSALSISNNQRTLLPVETESEFQVHSGENKNTSNFQITQPINELNKLSNIPSFVAQPKPKAHFRAITQESSRSNNQVLRFSEKGDTSSLQQSHEVIKQSSSNSKVEVEAKLKSTNTNEDFDVPSLFFSLPKESSEAFLRESTAVQKSKIDDLPFEDSLNLRNDQLSKDHPDISTSSDEKNPEIRTSGFESHETSHDNSSLELNNQNIESFLINKHKSSGTILAKCSDSSCILPNSKEIFTKENFDELKHSFVPNLPITRIFNDGRCNITVITSYVPSFTTSTVTSFTTSTVTSFMGETVIKPVEVFTTISFNEIKANRINKSLKADSKPIVVTRTEFLTSEIVEPKTVEIVSSNELNHVITHTHFMKFTQVHTVTVTETTGALTLTSPINFATVHPKTIVTTLFTTKDIVSTRTVTNYLTVTVLQPSVMFHTETTVIDRTSYITPVSPLTPVLTMTITHAMSNYVTVTAEPALTMFTRVISSTETVTKTHFTRMCLSTEYPNFYLASPPKLREYPPRYSPHYWYLSTQTQSRRLSASKSGRNGLTVRNEAIHQGSLTEKPDHFGLELEEPSQVMALQKSIKGSEKRPFSAIPLVYGEPFYGYINSYTMFKMPNKKAAS